MSEYSVVVETDGADSYFAYVAKPWRDGRVVAETRTDTIWGARWWAKRAAKKDRKVTRRLEFGVKA